MTDLFNQNEAPTGRGEPKAKGARPQTRDTVRQQPITRGLSQALLLALIVTLALIYVVMNGII